MYVHKLWLELQCCGIKGHLCVVSDVFSVHRSHSVLEVVHLIIPGLDGVAPAVLPAGHVQVFSTAASCSQRGREGVCNRDISIFWSHIKVYPSHCMNARKCSRSRGHMATVCEDQMEKTSLLLLSSLRVIHWKEIIFEVLEIMCTIWFVKPVFYLFLKDGMIRLTANRVTCMYCK